VIDEKPESFHTDWSETLNAVANSPIPIIPPYSFFSAIMELGSP